MLTPGSTPPTTPRSSPTATKATMKTYSSIPRPSTELVLSGSAFLNPHDARSLSGSTSLDPHAAPPPGNLPRSEPPTNRLPRSCSTPSCLTPPLHVLDRFTILFHNSYYVIVISCIPIDRFLRNRSQVFSLHSSSSFLRVQLV